MAQPEPVMIGLSVVGRDDGWTLARLLARPSVPMRCSLCRVALERGEIILVQQARRQRLCGACANRGGLLSTRRASDSPTIPRPPNETD